MRRKRRWLRLALPFIVGFVFVAVGGVALTAHIVDTLRYTYETPLLAGVWVGEPGNVFELNADGTGRGRANHTTRIQFLRWNERDGILSVFYEPMQKSLAWKTEQMLRGLPMCAHFRYRIDSVGDHALRLHDPLNDKSLNFMRSTVEAFDRQEVPDSGDPQTESAREAEPAAESDLGGKSSPSAG